MTLGALPRVTVLMPVRNGARWLNEAVESVLSQTFSNLELVAVDDGSTDETPDILARHAARDSRVRLLHQSPAGLVAALNAGLAAARAPLVARLDADDIASPQRLERQVGHLSTHERIGLLGSWAEKIDAQGRAEGRITPAVDPDVLRQVLASTNPFIHSSVMFSTALARDLGGYRAAFEAAEDYDLWLRISEVSEVANLPEMLVRYRSHAANVTSRKIARQSFSARMAKAASRLRRTTGRDPAAELNAPPDWWAADAETAFYADAARISRFLELADPAVACRCDLGRVDLRTFAGMIGELTHGERKLAQLAIVNLLRRADRGNRLPTGVLTRLLFRLHPFRAAQLAWSAQDRSLAR